MQPLQYLLKNTNSLIKDLLTELETLYVYISSHQDSPKTRKARRAYTWCKAELKHLQAEKRTIERMIANTRRQRGPDSYHAIKAWKPFICQTLNHG
jgi:hypothetical protein